MTKRALSICLAAAACAPGGYQHLPYDPSEVPGGSSWTDPGSGSTASDDPRCASDADCESGETCRDGICQMQRCTQGPYRSNAPVGDGLQFLADREVVVADSTMYQGAYWIDGYEDSTYSGSWEGVGAPPTDVTGGRFGGGAEGVAAAFGGRAIVAFERPEGGWREVVTPFVPVAIDAGDTDRDQEDEVVAFGADARVAVCRAKTARCDGFQFTGGEVGLDVAIADVDGDRYEEPVFLVEVGGARWLYVWNTDAALTGQPESVAADAVHELVRIDAGDLDGDGVAEIVGLEDGGYYGWADDKLHGYVVGGTAIAAYTSLDVDSGALDVALGDFDMDRRQEIAVLRDDKQYDLLSGAGAGFTALGTRQLALSGTPQRVALVDFDGDSPRGRLVGGPELVPGEVVPTIVLTLPPYDAEHSQGVSSLYVGNSNDTSQTLADSVSLKMGVSLGYEASVFGLFDAGLSAELGREVSTSRSVSQAMTVGERFILEARPQLHGPDYSAVVLSCGCFHKYTYELVDPKEKLGPNGSQYVMLVPVGGHTTLWSSRRYNAMAEAVGGLPLVEPTARLGDPDAYPASPMFSDGSPVPTADILFPHPPRLQVSDVGNVGWWLGVSSSETNEQCKTTSLSLSAHVTVAGFNLGGNVGGSFGQSYAVSVGSEAVFGGDVPPLGDDPTTPEDEYALYRYSFTPLVYRRHYTDRGGNDAAYYVLGYTVGR